MKFFGLLMLAFITGCVSTQSYVVETPYRTSYVYYYREGDPRFTPNMVYIERYHCPRPVYIPHRPTIIYHNESRRNDYHGRKP